MSGVGLGQVPHAHLGVFALGVVRQDGAGFGVCSGQQLQLPGDLPGQAAMLADVTAAPGRVQGQLQQVLAPLQPLAPHRHAAAPRPPPQALQHSKQMMKKGTRWCSQAASKSDCICHPVPWTMGNAVATC